MKATMHGKTYVVPLQDMMSNFLPDLANDKPNSDTIPNMFADVPKFLSEEEMKEYVIGGYFCATICFRC